MSGPARHMWPKLWEWQVLHYNLIKKRGSNAEICSSFIVSAPRTKWWIPWSCSGSTVHPQVVEIIKSFEDGDGWRLNETWVDGLCSFSNGGKRSRSNFLLNAWIHFFLELDASVALWRYGNAKSSEQSTQRWKRKALIVHIVCTNFGLIVQCTYPSL